MSGCKWLGAIGLLLAACGMQPGVVVDIGAWPAGATALRVAGTLDGLASAESLSFPSGTTRFVVYVPDGRSGQLGMEIFALDENECSRASASAQVELPGGLRALTEVQVMLTALTPPVCPAPEVQAVSPALGPTAGGAMLTVTGRHFIPGLTLWVDGSAASALTWSSPTQLSAALPAHPGAFGLVPVVVQNPDGQQAKRSDLFAYYASQPGFSSATPFATDKLPAAVAAGDFNGDGALDLVTANGQSSVSVLLGDGKGSFGAATTIGTYPNASSVATGDVKEN